MGSSGEKAEREFERFSRSRPRLRFPPLFLSSPLAGLNGLVFLPSRRQKAQLVRALCFVCVRAFASSLRRVRGSVLLLPVLIHFAPFLRLPRTFC